MVSLETALPVAILVAVVANSVAVSIILSSLAKERGYSLSVMPTQNTHGGFLASLKLGKLFKNQPQAEADVVSRLGRAGYFFIATTEEASELDLVVGPKLPIKLSADRTSPPLVPSSEIPHLYEPDFLALAASAVLNSQEKLSLEIVRCASEITLYRFPSTATSLLAELTPQRPDFTRAEIETFADRLVELLGSNSTYKRGGITAVIHILRAHALKAVPRESSKELYYWFWRAQP